MLVLVETWMNEESSIGNEKLQVVDKSILLFVNDKELGKELRAQCKKAIVVTNAEIFREVDEENIEMDFQNETHFVQLHDFLKSGCVKTDIIINAVSINSHNKESMLGIYLQFNIAKYLLEKDMDLFYLFLKNCNEYLNFGISGMNNVIENENSYVRTHCIEIDTKDIFSIDLIAKEITDSNRVIKYSKGKRFVRKLQETTMKPEKDEFSCKGKTFLIIGGLGGIGKLFCKYLLSFEGTKVVLCGRKDITQVEETLRGNYSYDNVLLDRVTYYQCDISQKNSVEKMVNTLRQNKTKVDCILGMAGVANDMLIKNKKKEDFETVIAPKLSTLEELPFLIENLQVNDVVLFSSIASVVGAIGQVDYAYANATQNYYAELQDNEKYRIISIAWPLWHSLGLQASDRIVQMMKKQGFDVLLPADGMRMFIEALSQKSQSELIVFQGDNEKMRERLGLSTISRNIDEKESVFRMINENDLRACVRVYIKQTISSITQHEYSDIGDYDDFETLGIDSVKMVAIIEKMEGKLGKLPKTLFFEYQSVDELVEFVATDYERCFENDLTENSVQLESDSKETFEDSFEAWDFSDEDLDVRILSEDDEYKENNGMNNAAQKEPIAIIGMSGEFPKAKDIGEFWENLLNGKDCIVEIPSERWDYNDIYEENTKKIGKTNCKWGGFIDGMEEFDAEFFKYSPIEAVLIDPQERLFLENAWNAMEDSGYTRDSLKKERVGVFVGASWAHYQNMKMEYDENDFDAVSSFSSIANRVSYFFNLTGPSIAIDTMCSSSGTAIHLACESIWNNESTLAFAGGVNLTIGEAKYRVLSAKNYLSSEGKCRSFGEGGDGYVPGEGVGCIILKPLSAALRDGNHVDGVILATGVNHGGKSTGYSVPNVNAQADLIERTLEKFHIAPEDISYIEAHGTGTPLGDPVEILGLSRGLNIEKNPDIVYEIGSVKSNVGHLESAAAVAALIKVVLQMKNKTLVPSIHSSELNKKIDFDKLPFKVVQAKDVMTPRKTRKDDAISLLSTVSSFGAGGSNAFLVVGNYESGNDLRKFEIKNKLVVLSANNREALHENVKKIHKFLRERGEIKENELVDICHTLQSGREAMRERVAFIVKTGQELTNKLSVILNNETRDGIYLGNARTAGGEIVDIDNLNMSQLAELWVKGHNIDWNILYKNEECKPRYISLPTYSFQKKRYWIEDYSPAENTASERTLSELLIDYNHSTLDRQLYSKKISLSDSFFGNHVVGGKAILPGAVYLEMARQASALALTGIGNVYKLNNVIFEKTFSAENIEDDLYIELYPMKNEVDFEIKSELGEKIFCSGTASYTRNNIESINIQEAKFDFWNNENAVKEIYKEEIYQYLKVGGFSYGEYYRIIDKLALYGDYIIADLSLSDKIYKDNENFVLKPSVLDGALQTMFANFESSKDATNYLPFEIGELLIYGKLTQKCTVVNRIISKGSNYIANIYIYNDNGDLVVRINGYTVVGFNTNKIKLSEKQNANVQDTDKEVLNKIRDFVYNAIAKETGVEVSAISDEDDFEKFGIDSVMSMRITEHLDEVFGNLSTTVFYEVKSVDNLVKYLYSEYRDVINSKFGSAVKTEKLDTSEEVSMPLISRNKVCHRNRKRIGGNNIEDIAIIGIDGRYPKADNLDEFWKNLQDGKDCVNEVPIERWDYRPLYNPDKNVKGKIYSKWGGFINGAEEFDSEFFGIVPLQAIVMDPQERIYLQTAWHCVEDAGYSLKTLSDYNVGVYTGEMWGDYQKIGVEETLNGNTLSLSSSFASTSNKVSYVMNLHGPSMTVDTMCSSSLTAIDLACNALHDGTIDMAIAGGVNLTLHPDKYISLCQGKFLSSEGKCRAFGEGGDGYVPSEGVGAVLLKRLSDAERDGDHIYAVIKATSVNHGGKSNAYFVPNVEEQKNLIVSALEKANISPRTISSVEAHGTGTALGDPIEVAGFNKAYKSYTDDVKFCSLGSVKSNIGHCESAAGIAAITKIVLELKNKQLVPSLHSQVLNSKIDFDNSPFYVQHELEEWKKPVIVENGNEIEYPRRAAVSAFGAGGTNVHIILEEYNNKGISRDILDIKERVFLISAKKKEQLTSLLIKYVDFLQKQTFPNSQQESAFLADLEATLIYGREEFGERIAILATSVEELVTGISKYLEGSCAGKVYSGNIKANNSDQEIFNDEDGQIYINMLVEKKYFSKLAQLWIKGVKVEWKQLVSQPFNRLSLPLYPFERTIVGLARGSSTGAGIFKLHNVVDQNVSTIQNSAFDKVFNGNEFYLSDHIIGNKSILPGVVYLEMFKVASELAVADSSVERIKNVVWRKPFVVDQNQAKALIRLEPGVESVKCSLESVSCMGAVGSCAEAEIELVEKNDLWVSNDKVDIEEYIEECQISVDKTIFYNKLREINFVYGDRMQGIRHVYVSENQKKAYVLVEEKENVVEANEFSLHPMIMDAGVQAVATLIDNKKKAYLPYSIGEVELLADSTDTKYILIQKRNSGINTVSFDLTYVDSEGKVLIKLSDLSVKEQKIAAEEQEIHYYSTELTESEKPLGIDKENVVLLFDDNDALYNTLQKQFSKCVLVTPAKDFMKVSSTLYNCERGNEQSYISILKEVLGGAEKWSSIIYHREALSKDSDRLNYGTEVFALIKAVLLSGISKKVQFVHLFEGTIESEKNMKIDPVYLACAGMFKTAVAESGKLVCKNIAVDNRIASGVDELSELLGKEVSKYAESVEEIFYTVHKKKYVRTMIEIPYDVLTQEKKIAIRKNGVYVITGGMKGVGYLFASYIAETYGATLVLLGRSMLDKDAQRKLEKLVKFGGKAEYCVVDVNDRSQVDSCLKAIREVYGSISGIIHSAGVKKDELIINKTQKTFTNTITTKVRGLENLCDLTENDKLDFFVAFSSIAGLMGNVGQVDYAYANNFMDSYAFIGRMKGRNIITINWPYWKSGGMQLRQSDIDNMKKNNGMLPLLTDDGIRAFELLLGISKKYCHALVLSTIKKEESVRRLQNTCELKAKKTQVVVEKQSISARESAEMYMKNIISDETKINISKIRSDDNFEMYGFDSVVIMNMIARLNEDFHGVPKTLFYDLHCVNEVVDYLEKNYVEEFANLFSLTGSEETASVEIETVEKQIERKRIVFNYSQTKQKKADSDEDIAIVAIHVKTAEAENIEQFWKVLLEAQNCMKTIPNERFEYEKYYSEKPGDIGKTYCKFGGFIKGVEDFDPLFFHVAPNNAMFMDPLERLLLEAVWYLFENAGYKISNLKTREIGVFIGAMWQQYQMLLMNGPAQGMIPSLFSNLSNRISSYYNLIGPSISLDTMCSSSLTALQMAINSIKMGECSSAIVGGINLSLHQSKYINLSQGGLLSHGDRCIPFGKGADGYLPSEGIGLILIKPLTDAIKDRDNIQCVIKASSIAHSGKGSGYMIPNTKMQVNVIKKAYEKSNISVDTIGYIEAQGICTEAGDAMEFSAISNAYKEFTDKKNYCALGSAKYAIGHTEAASGILALAKIIMQMKNHMIAGILVNEEKNEELDLQNSPLYIPQKNIPWKRLEKDGVQLPLRAALNGFGGAGAYTHFILEEYVQQNESYDTSPRENAFVVSAKTKTALDNNVAELLKYIKTGSKCNQTVDEDFVMKLISQYAGFDYKNVEKSTLIHELALSQKAYVNILNEINSSYNLELMFDEITKFVTVGDFVNYINNELNISSIQEESLNRVAYTLQVGRESMQYRVAFIAMSRAQLICKLEQYCTQKTLSKDIFDIEDIENIILKELVDNWMQGREVDWNKLYENRYPKKVQLPNYVFDNKKYWLPREYVVDLYSNKYAEEENVERFAHTEMICEKVNQNETKELEPKNQDMITKYTPKNQGGDTELNIKEQVASIVAQELGVDLSILDYDVDLKEYGLDSFIAQRIFMRIAECCNLQLSFGMFSECITIRNICENHEDNNMNISENAIDLVLSDEDELALLLKLQSGNISVEEALYMEGKDGQTRNL